MAEITQLSTIAVPGKVKNFSAKDEEEQLFDLGFDVYYKYVQEDNEPFEVIGT